MFKVKDIISELEKFAPLSYQEDYDNAGIIIGNPDQECKAVLLTIDVTESIIEEAIKKGSNLIIAHHPLVFSGLKKIIGRNYIERSVIKAIKNDIAIYAAHTNIDNVLNGVNNKISEKLGLINCQILKPTKNQLKKLVTFIPISHADKVREAVFSAGAGHIGNYDCCSYNIAGKGSFRALDGTNPFVGNKGELHFEEELRFETIFPDYLQKTIIDSLLASHPYEEVAYDIYSLDNENQTIGAGLIGDLETSIPEKEFLELIKQKFEAKVVRHTKLLNKPIQKVAICGGSGSFLVKDAIQKKADIFITGDFKYHQFFDAENKIIIADIGHYESEQFTKELFYDILIKKLPNFAIYFSELITNPIYYF
jgi:dinuclear metal center YbgI/SA1388 family protein